MNEILIAGRRLRLRRANETDLNYIMALQFAPENLKFIVPFDEEFQREVITSDGSEKMSVIIEELDGTRAGYFLLRELDSPCAEFTHVIIDRKGLGYGRESLKLLLAWTFETKKFHRVWIDCKEYNSIALNLYESLGFVREGLLREILLTNGVYENLIVFGMLDREYFARQTEV
ncbi:MAG: GNAT family N-acetyltransferase [Selenomonadaceae bacterium]|nr:GNAT family N-acetyltransferase [Selenomonadaceae bacterium]